MAKEKITTNKDGTKRALSNRLVQMIAIGGTIGTGLFLGSGTTIHKVGPSILLVYLIIGLFMFFMMRAIGEMFYSDPSKHTFVSFISRYLGPSAGHFSGWTYWLGLIFSCMAELTAIASYVQFWLPGIPTWFIEVFFLGVLMTVNLIAARIFGEAEFWFSMIKIFAILALIFTGIFMAFGHATTPVGHASLNNIFQNFTLFPRGSFNFISSFPMVFFAFIGIEFVSITIGESKAPRKVLKKAVNETLLRILIFYLGALVAIMLIIPWNTLSASSSPFVQVFKIAGIPAAASIINFVVLTSAASSLNSCIFSGARHFYQLSDEMPKGNFMHKKFATISKNGVPSAAIIFTSTLVLIAPLLSLFKGVASSFTIVTGSSSDMTIIVYLLTMVAHRKYRASKDFLPKNKGFLMPGYNIISPITIAFFALVFVSLFTLPDDVIGAIGAIIWTVVFGGITYLRQRKEKKNIVSEDIND